MRRGGRKTVQAEVMTEFKEIVFSGHSRTVAYVSAQARDSTHKTSSSPSQTKPQDGAERWKKAPCLAEGLLEAAERQELVFMKHVMLVRLSTSQGMDL